MIPVSCNGSNNRRRPQHNDSLNRLANRFRLLGPPTSASNVLTAFHVSTDYWCRILHHDFLSITLSRYSSASLDELVSACTDSRDATAWEEFVHRFHTLIATVALRTARKWTNPASSLLDDLVQETYLKLCADDCRLLRDFRPQHEGAIFAFLKILTTNVVHDHFKARHAMKRGSGETEESLDGSNHNSGIRSGTATRPKDLIEHDILLRQIDSCLIRSVDADEITRSRRIFWLYYRWGMSARAIASLPGIGLTTKGVETALRRLSGVVKTELARLPSPERNAFSPPKGITPSGSF